jgi:lipid II:glycine glycyltransferase (peptidoglycan interpeptide bridge formation enzyme)
VTSLPRPRGPGIPVLRVVREAAPDELGAWDARTVDVPGGDVQQSQAWAIHRSRTGWDPRHLVLDDGSAVLALGRPWRLIGGGRLYLPKGPVMAGAAPEAVAGRLAAVASWARGAGYDAIVADAEVPAATGYQGLLAGLGFHQVEEIGPSRHRIGVPIARDADETALLEAIARTTRQRFLAAERKGTRIVRYDRASAAVVPGVDGPPADRLIDAAEEAFGRFHALLLETGARRGFEIGGRTAALAWWRAALEAGHLVLLEARGADDAYLGGAIFYRHGERLTYSSSADVVALRHVHPGTVHLLLWRALQLALREGRVELDLGGVDVRGARHEPQPGEPMHGLLEFKRSFGGQWIELAGAHERVLRRARHAVARGAQRAAGAVRSAPGTPGRRAAGPP